MNNSFKCLAIIDMQKTFLNPNEKHFKRHPQAANMLTNLKDLPKRIYNFVDVNKNIFDVIFLTKFINTKESSFVKYLNFNRRMKGKELEFVEEMQRLIEENNFPVFEKNTYSIFKSKNLNNFLSKHLVKQIFFVGICLEGCILASAFDGFDLGYDVKVLLPLCSTAYGKEAFNSGIKIFKTFLPNLLLNSIKFI